MMYLASWVLVPAVGLVALTIPHERMGNGRHVSRPVGRLLGWPQHSIIFSQAGLCLFSIGFLLTGLLLGLVLMQGLMLVWLGDDWLTGDPDDEDGHRYEWARNKLQALKPVKVRPVESWQPA